MRMRRLLVVLRDLLCHVGRDVGDLLCGELVFEGGHAAAAVLDLFDDGVEVFGARDAGQVGAAVAAEA
jgi:Na+/glutamate symporter